MNDYISRDAALKALCQECCGSDVSCRFPCEDYNAVLAVPAADVVTREAFNRILTENNTMREQLAAIGKKPGDDMTDIQMLTCCCCCGDSKVVEIDQVKEDDQ